MDITLEMIDQVRERTGATYEDAKKAIEANGNVIDAIIALEKEEKEGPNELLEKIKAAVKKGNVTKIRVCKDDKELVSIPVTAGVAGGVLGLMTAPGIVVTAAVIGAVAKFGLDCRFELVEEDGTVRVLGEEKAAGEKCCDEQGETCCGGEEDKPEE